MTGKVAADPCHPMQCRSLQKQKSSRWVRAEFPRCVDDPCVPAFPHKGTQRDLAKLKRLLKILRGVVKASHTCLPFYLHTQNPMVAASKPTTEGDGHQATLKHVVHILKQIGSSFLAKDCGLPTVHELRLYGLILRHVNSCMLLYLMEESSKQDIVPAELIDHAVQQVGCFLSDNHIDVDESVMDSFVDHDDVFFDAWNGFYMMTSLLQECASSIPKLSLGEGVALFGPARDSSSTDIKTRVAGHVSTSDPLVLTKKSVTGHKRQYSEGNSVDCKEAMKKRKFNTCAFDADEKNYLGDGKVIAANDRVELLLNILRGMGNIRRMRSYAPPLAEEMKYYRLIWAHVMLLLGFLNSISRLGKLPASSGDMLDRVFTFLGDSFESIDSIPAGWKLSVTLESIPDLITLVKVCEDHLLEAFGNRRYPNEDSVVENDSVSKEREQEHWPHGFDTVTGNLYFGGRLWPQNDGGDTVEKARIECLHDILCLLKSINWNGLPTTVEQRLYARFADHILSTTWMHESERLTKEDNLPSWIAESGSWSPEKQKPFVGTAESMRKCDFVVKWQTTDACHDEREKTREQCLHEIVLLVEAVESSFLDHLPTVQELSCYQEMERHMDKNFMQTTCPLMTRILARKPHLQLHHLALMDHFVKFVLDMERKALKQVDEECRKMLGTIIPNFEWEYGEKFIGAIFGDDEVALKAFLQQRLCDELKHAESLELAIMILDGARMCSDWVFNRLFDAVDHLNDLTDWMKYEEGMAEVCHVPGVMGSLFELIN